MGENCCDVGECIRERYAIPRGQMLGSEIFLACHDAKTGELCGGTEPCAMCKRTILNAGIVRVYVRDTRDVYRVIETSEWLENDESLFGRDSY